MATSAPAAPATQDLDVPAIQGRLQAAFDTGRTRPLSWRRAQLKRLLGMLTEREDDLLAALKQDLGKSAAEGYGGEVGFLITEIKHTLKHLAKWARPEKVSTPIVNQPGKSYIIREPLGLVLVIAPWNYPLQLLVSPLHGAIAAGNCAVLKPSELAPATSRLCAELLPRYLDPDCFAVVEGAVPETTALLDQPWDHVFFTGSTRVGKVVMAAAARHLTPVTLELGGKSPCIVDRDVDIGVAARRIAWGKWFNAGQTCVAPDYVLVHEERETELLTGLQGALREFYGEDPKASPDFGRIVSEAHHQRLTGFLTDGELVAGGQADAAQRYLAPTILRQVDPEAAVMQDEIFGPILPILTVKSVDEAIGFVRRRPKPLALYVYSSNRANTDRVLEQTSSGGACVNDCVAHLATPDLPFGGVGPSGMGAYHGKFSFETFSHRKSVLDKSTWIDVKLRYPPYAGKLKWFKRLMG
jgi:aldehyde dehydrogenase (NAD+)